MPRNKQHFHPKKAAREREAEKMRKKIADRGKTAGELFKEGFDEQMKTVKKLQPYIVANAIANNYERAVEKQVEKQCKMKKANTTKTVDNWKKVEK